MKRILAMICALVLIAVAMLPVLAVAEKVMYVKTANRQPLKMRSEPNTRSKDNIRYEAPYGTPVKLIRSVNRTWVEVMTDGYDGGSLFCMRRYLSTHDPLAVKVKKDRYEAEDYTEFVQLDEDSQFNIIVIPTHPTGTVNFRRGPSKANSVLRRLRMNEELTVTAVGNVWYKATLLKTGESGFIQKAFTDKVD